MAESDISREIREKATRAAVSNPWVAGIGGALAVIGAGGLALWLWLRGREPEEVTYAVMGSMDLALTPGPQVVYAIMGSMDFALAALPSAVVYAVLGEMNFTLLAPSVSGYTLTTGIVPTGGSPTATISLDHPGPYQWGEAVTVWIDWTGLDWYFDYWTLDGTIYSYDQVCVVYMYGDRSLNAYMHYQQAAKVNMTLDKSPNIIYNHVTVNGAEVSTPTSYVGVDAGTVVILETWADWPSYFMHWIINGATVSANPYNLTLNVNTSVVAVFGEYPT